jgi:KipI family sensor histidine kinase inhibitor
VVYGGEDLDDVAELAGLSREEVVAAHAGGDYVVAFCGFAPGFGYLTGLDERLHVPRRDSPRKRVPAGAVAVADTFTAVYPRPSPGGWQLIGHTGETLWDTDRDPPALLVPGTRVRFTETR